MAPEGQIRIEDVWGRLAYDLAGNCLGVVEAVAFRRGTVRRVGVPMRDSERRGIKFFSVDGIRLQAGRLVFPQDDRAHS